VLLPLLIGAFVAMLVLSRPAAPGRELRVDEFFRLVRQGRVETATILAHDKRVAGTDVEGTFWTAYAEQDPQLLDRIFTRLDRARVRYRVDGQWAKGLVQPVTPIFPALIFVDAFFLVFLLTRSGAGLRSQRHSPGRGARATTFADVAGTDEAVEELRDVKEYLENPERFAVMGARVPRGILLSGPPGCGKTLLARALAGEAGVPFYPISGSDFVEVYVGVGASRIRELFRKARRAAPAIVFIDEIDAVGRGRQVDALAGQDERESTLNQLLVEMDGFDPSLGVVVLAATNRPDILDPALMRAGRFDRRLFLDPPDVRGRRSILDVHCRDKPLDPDVDLDLLARRTPGFAGADLSNVVNEAALLATRRGGATIRMADFAEAVERLIAGGPERRSRVIGPAERRVIALHESGHAVAAAAMTGAEPPAKLSIVSRGRGLGSMLVEAVEDRFLATRPELVRRMAVLLAGRAAERMVLGEPSTGSQDDLVRANRLAESMVRSLGMSERLGSLVLGPEENAGGGRSDALNATVDGEIRRILDEAERHATAILTRNREALEGLAGRLIERETLEGEELGALLARVHRLDPGYDTSDLPGR
jgi:cell division protease FtsH